MSEGHWRKLKPGQSGNDEFGNKVYGKTWVRRKGKRKSDKIVLDTPKELKQVEVVKKETKLSPAQKDIAAWRKWKESGSEEDLVVLMDRFAGTVAQTVYQFRSAPVPPSVIEGAANVKLLEAIKTYQEGKGSNLNSWVTQRLLKVGVFVGKYQNLGKIPEHRRLNIQRFKETQSELEESLGHKPSAQLLAEKLQWSIAEVTRMESELSRRDLIASQSLEPDKVSEREMEEAQERRVFRNVYHALEDETERLVFEYTSGFNGKEELKAGAIAKKLKIHPSKVSRIRKKIDKMFNDRGI